MTEDPSRWGQPFAALLGAYSAQMGFGLPSIGGKDSMSGTFNDLDVPPTLVSFAVDVASDRTIITPELKTAGNKLVLFAIEKDEYDLPVLRAGSWISTAESLRISRRGRIVSAYEVERCGLAEAVSKMAFGNKLGVKIEHNVAPEDLFAPGWGNIVAEVPDGQGGRAVRQLYRDRRGER